MSRSTVNEAGKDGGGVTVALPELARALARHRPGHPAACHISNLIEQLRNYDRNPEGLRPRILQTIDRVSAFIKNDT